MCLAQGQQWSDAGEARTRGPSVLSQALYHWATALPLYMLGNYSCFCCHLLIFSKLIFQKLFQEHYQSGKRFRSRYRTLILIWSQTVYKGYQQTTKVASSMVRVKKCGNNNTGFKLGPDSREKWLLPPGKWGRSGSQIGRSYSVKLQHFLPAKKQMSTIAIKQKEKYNAVVVDCHHSLCLCSDRMKMSPPKKIYFFRETPTSSWVPFRAEFWPLGWLILPSHPLAYSLII